MSLELNKIAAAVLVAGLVGAVAGKVADTLYHPEEPKARGYAIAGAEDADGGGGASAAKQEGPVDILPLLAAADPEKGKGLAKACATCHSFEKGGPDGVGPNLWGMVGRGVGTHSGFAYSDAVGKLGGNWDFQRLSEFLAKPSKYAPGTKMSFIGISKPEDRAAVLRYLNTMGDAPLPLPKGAVDAGAPKE